MTMQTILQVKVTYCRSIKLNPLTAKVRTDIERLLASPSSTAPAEEHPNLSLKLTGTDSTEQESDTAVAAGNNEDAARAKSFFHSLFAYSKNFVIIDKETKTSQRDWTEPR